MSVQDAVKSTRQTQSLLKRAGLWRAILAQLIAMSIVIIAGWNMWADMFAWVMSQNLKLRFPDTSYLTRLPLYIMIHIGAATTSLCLGAIVLYGRKGTAAHKLMGRTWLLAMATTSISSFFMTSFAPMLGQFGPIHILAVWTLITLPNAIILARRGDITGHMRAMKGAYLGLVIAGVMTFLPGRTMFAMFFG